MPHPSFTLRPTQIRQARTLTRAAFSDADDTSHRQAVEIVVGELVGAALEAGVHDPVELTIARYPLLTSVRLRCSHEVELQDDPFRLRTAILGKLTLACGRRHNPDGTADLWAEIPRRPQTR